MNYLDAHIILDRSGSMERTREITVAAVNDYVKNLRADQSLQATVSLTTFDTTSIDRVWDKQSAHDCELKYEQFQPRGGTPLYDAVGGVVTTLPQKASKTAIVIVTDGEENSSREWSQSAIKGLLDRVQKDFGWLVMFLAANIDAFKAGAAVGANAGHTMSYKPEMARNLMASVARSHSVYASNQGSTEFTDEERAAAKGETKTNK